MTLISWSDAPFLLSVKNKIQILGTIEQNKNGEQIGASQESNAQEDQTEQAAEVP